MALSLERSETSLMVARDNPPLTEVESVTDILHGIEVVDPYRWLEDQNSLRTRAWLEHQRQYTQRYFCSISTSYRNVIRQRLTELLIPLSKSAPWITNGKYFFLGRVPQGEQPAILMREGFEGSDTVLVNPATFEVGSALAVAISAVSVDGRFLAYAVRRGGTDHARFHFLDVAQKIILPEQLSEGYSGGIVFAVDGTGFFYCHRSLQDARPNYRAAFWHQFGTDHSEDREVFYAGESANIFLAIRPSSDGSRLLYIVFSAGKEPRVSVYLHSLLSDRPPRLLIDDIEATFNPFFVGGKLLAYTDYKAKNFRIVEVDVDDPSPDRWHDVVPESNCIIQQFATVGDRIFVTLPDCYSAKVHSFTLDGKLSDGLECAPYGTVTLHDQPHTKDELVVSYTSISKPVSIYCYRAGESRAYRVWEEADVSFDPSGIALEEIEYESKDGVRVPLLLAARKDLLNSSPLPTFLTGYGGFGSCVTPRFTALATFLIEQGCLFAVPALRGGAELGKEWHLAGKGTKRQNSFDDFISAAEWLVSHKRSIPGRIAIGGGSNAGLLVGVAITQRPDLFRAAICLGPLLDMIRYHKFDLATRWTDEYGCAEDPGDFPALWSYSPYHRIVAGADYPAVLFVSGDADTRCNPMHVRKMTARMQAATASEHPVLLDYKTHWGHTPVQPISTKVESLTDRLAFLCHELGIQVTERRS
jgi:prolyl oligopeptidase